MIVGRRGFIAGLAAAFAAPRMLTLPVRGNLTTYVNQVNMRCLTNYAPDVDIARLDVLYGRIKMRPEWSMFVVGKV